MAKRLKKNIIKIFLNIQRIKLKTHYFSCTLIDNKKPIKIKRAFN